MYDDDSRSPAWLRRFATQPLAPLPRVQRYLGGILAVDRPLDLAPLLAGGLPRATAYHLSRGGAALLGRKAFLWHTPGTPHHQSPAVVDEIRTALRAFHDRQTRDGDFAMGDAWAEYLPHHSHAWRLEPMLWARLWLNDVLTASDRRWLDPMLRRAARRQLWFPRQSPNDTLQYCNRGAVWCAVTTLAGLVLEDERYLREVERHAERILTHTITPRGEILEGYLHYQGGGPDTGYSFTTWIYVCMYRLLSGRTDLDPLLLAAQRWAVQTLTHSGFPLASGASVRHATRHAWVCDLLPGLELLADQEPWFDALADRLLGRGVEHAQGHCLHPFIWAALCHRKRPAVPAPAWYRDHEATYEHQASQYTQLHHRYQTGLVWRGLHPCRGLQTFAWQDEPPLIHPTGELVSTLLAEGVDSAATNLAAGPSGWELFRRTGGPGDGYEPASPATVLLARRGSLWECYVATSAALLVITGGPGPLAARWVIHDDETARARVVRRARRLTLAGRQAQLCWLPATAELSQQHGRSVLTLTASAAPLVMGFGDAALRLERWLPATATLHFRDASGRYALCLDQVLDAAGNLNREPSHWDRLQRR